MQGGFRTGGLGRYGGGVSHGGTEAGAQVQGGFRTEAWGGMEGEFSHGGTEDTEVVAQVQGARGGMEGMFLTEDMRGVFIGS